MATLVAPTLEPFGWYRRMREQEPVAYDAARGCWDVFRYEDVKRVLSDYQAFSSGFDGASGREGQPLGASLVSTDPPRHRQLRALVTQAFTPRAVARLAHRIAELVDHLLAPLLPAGRMDLIEDFAYPLPVIVIAELLGIPAEERDQFKRWSDAMVTGSAQYHGGGDAQQEMAAYFARLIAARRATPRDDLISALLEADIGGERLSERELLGFCILLLIAGNETTTNLLGNAVLCLDEQPGLQARLQTETALLAPAIEEVLRHRSPVQSMFRRAARETELGGRRIAAGQRVTAWIGSANRDGDQFPDPDRFDPARAPNQHLAFGAGVHYCLGAPLARLEGQLALGAMLARLPELRRDPAFQLDPVPSTIVYGVRRLPVTFRPTKG